MPYGITGLERVKNTSTPSRYPWQSVLITIRQNYHFVCVCVCVCVCVSEAKTKLLGEFLNVRFASGSLAAYGGISVEAGTQFLSPLWTARPQNRLTCRLTLTASIPTSTEKPAKHRTAPWRWFLREPKHVGVSVIILNCFNISVIFIIVCISWNNKKVFRQCCVRDIENWYDRLRHFTDFLRFD